jgi:two-component system, response regulator PdtaR
MSPVLALYGDFTRSVRLPKLEALKLAQVIRDRWQPVALLVTSGKERDIKSDLPKGARFLLKPYLRFQLETTLRELLQ